MHTRRTIILETKKSPYSLAKINTPNLLGKDQYAESLGHSLKIVRNTVFAFWRHFSCGPPFSHKQLPLRGWGVSCKSSDLLGLEIGRERFLGIQVSGWR